MFKKKIAICIPSKIAVKTLWLKHFTEFIASLKYDYKIFVGYDPTIPIDLTRERLVDDVLRDRTCNWTFWVDDDIILPLNTLDKMFASKKNIVTGIYWSKLSPNLPVLRKSNRKNELMAYKFYNHEDNRVFPIYACGMGCFLIKTKLLYWITKPRFRAIYPNGVGEDLYFCQLLYEAGLYQKGFTIYATADVLCRHMIFEKEKLVTYPTEEMLRKVNAKYNP